MWSTKNRAKIITKSKREEILTHIKSNALLKGIHIDHINIVSDHIHVLISLNTDQTIAKVVQLIKGESSYWANKNKLFGHKFEWQDEYIAVSLSQSIVDKVRKYIRNQEEHHKIKTFMDEYNEFMNKFGFDIIKGAEDKKKSI
jgi:REP element-mobilizing transposase RayT